ncbi:BrnA antitoxin family protein [Phyllobacterium endophyticum]|uniref:BrnA antitoxin family protein n=1 Tax=Phyllobacterium endophyticum TaxID=1149773 RepID=UPI0017DA8B65|nr:BrnA antitoxin family protein [Phyllobacterium endophyticum]MBB3238078.1 hypothetical protein [Phyllobacterium endophyticum]
MTRTNIKRASLDDLQNFNKEGKLSRNPTPLEGEDLGPDFWANARVVEPKEPRSVHLKLDPDVFEFFKSQGKGHLTRMQEILKAYVKAHDRS